MAMRGGTVTASLKVGRYAGPLIPPGAADVLIGLDEQEALSHLPMLRQGGISVVNAAADTGTFSHVVDAAGVARSLGAPGAVNMIVLGLAAQVLGIDRSDIEKIVEELSPAKAKRANLKALQTGFDGGAR
jgi:indolepyruvate ferredoxin oxidoreductase beta subunit